MAWRKRIGVSAFGLSLVACGPPAPLSPQEVLRDTTPPQSIAVASKLAAGAEATFGETTVRIETIEALTAPRDLAKDAVMDSLALVVSSSASVEAAAQEIASAAERAKAGATATVSAGGTVTSVRVRVPLQEQAAAVKKGSLDVAKVAATVKQAAALALALGSLLGKEQEKVFLRIAAMSHGVPHRGTCSVKDEGNADLPRTSVSCAITRADAPPTTVWHLNVGTQESMAAVGQIVPASRGWLRPEPAAGAASIWIARPDLSGPFLRRSLADYSSFALQRDSVAVARMRIADETGPSGVWLARGAADEATTNAVAISLSVLALLRWPVVHPQTESR